MKMNVLKDWEELVSDLKLRIQNGDESCRPLLAKAEAALNAAREKEAVPKRDRHGR
jgi:hypothetical protein